jgi:hypothetical protein
VDLSANHTQPKNIPIKAHPYGSNNSMKFHEFRRWGGFLFEIDRPFIWLLDKPARTALFSGDFCGVAME